MSHPADFHSFNLKHAQAKNRIVGLTRMMMGYRLIYVGAIVALTVSTVARTGISLLVGTLVDDVLISQPTAVELSSLGVLGFPRVEYTHPDLVSLLPVFALSFLVLALIQGTFSYMSGRWAAYTAEKVTWRTRNYLFDHMQRLSFTYHDRMQTGELLQRSTSDVDAIRRFYVEQGVGIGRILVMFVVNFIAIWTLYAPLALLSVIIAPILAILSFYMFGFVARKYEEFQDHEAKLSSTLQEHLSGIRVVRAFARQEFEKDRFEERNWSLFMRGKELLMLDAFYWPMTDFLTGAQIVFSYFVAAIMVMNGTITLGVFVAYIGLVGMLINPLRQIGRLVVQAAEGLGSYRRVMEIVNEAREDLGEEQTPPVKAVRGELIFNHVNFQYDENTPVLKDITFTAKPGQVIALLGSTGSGKTSLVNLIPRFYDYTSGSITLDGVELRDYPKGFLRENIGIVEQEPFLFSRSIRENVSYGLNQEADDDSLHSAARAASIHDVILSFPEGYQTLVGERGVTLSGGQKQRTALARTLLKNPRIMILDDATSSVDTETDAAIREALSTRLKDCTTFIIAHRVTTLMHADMILVMDHGRIVQMGTHEELLLQEGIYRETYEMQSRIDEELEKELANVG